MQAWMNGCPPTSRARTCSAIWPWPSSTGCRSPSPSATPPPQPVRRTTSGSMSVSLRCCAVLAIAAAAGCTTTVHRPTEPGDAARRAADLNALLLTPDEIDSAMNATGMAVDTTTSTLVDDSPYTKPAECLAVERDIGQEHVYAGSTGARCGCRACTNLARTTAHLAHQAVVEFPTAAERRRVLHEVDHPVEGCARPVTPTARRRPARRHMAGRAEVDAVTPGC